MKVSYNKGKGFDVVIWDMWKEELCIFYFIFQPHMGIFVYIYKKLQTGQNVNNSDHTEVTFHGGYFLIWLFLLYKISLIDKNYLLNKDKYHTYTIF